ncbi:hypothetical protein RJ640_020112 [Escallonia rubra]|uniref:Uncharacterized protein n=1 Tax=Escallonia rubra TaxID=112253 RepID=A0AA88UCS9_9ASTE|nr:hypothetical protein RJ640_020112 [Escallonia rubra]
MSQNAAGSSSGPLQASAATTQNINPFLGQAQAAATTALPSLTPEQIQRLITFLESSPSGTDSLVGKSLPTTHTWLIDSGASYHMTGNLNLFSSIWDIPPSPVGLPDGLQTNAIKAGSVSLADNIILCHVLYVPNLAFNLISVSCLATDANCFVAFSHDICVLQDRTSKSPIGLGKMHRGVFMFQPLPAATVAAISKFESYELWHRRMGHPSSQPLIHLPTVSIVSPSLKTICDVCCHAKHSRTVFPNSTSRAMDIFGFIHCDIWGPYRVSTISGAKYFLIIVDDYSRAVWVYLMHDKGITADPDPEISYMAFPPSSPIAPSPTLGRGKRQNKASFILKDYVCHIAQVLPPTSSTPTNGSSGPSIACSSFKQYLNDCFKLKDLRTLKYFLGIKAARGPHGLFLSQRKYALDILSESGLSASKPAAFPMEQNHSLALVDGPLLSDPGLYRCLIGRLVYLTIIRPDICYAVHVLSQFMQSPRSQYWDAALWVLRYLKAAPDQGLFLPADSPLQIFAFCDSDWASCPLTRRSATRYFVSLGNSPISWRTKKQPIVSRSSAEAEYRSMAVTTCELSWLKSFLLSLGVHHDRPMRLFLKLSDDDNEAYAKRRRRARKDVNASFELQHDVVLLVHSDDEVSEEEKGRGSPVKDAHDIVEPQLLVVNLNSCNVEMDANTNDRKHAGNEVSECSLNPMKFEDFEERREDECCSGEGNKPVSIDKTISNEEDERFSPEEPEKMVRVNENEVDKSAHQGNTVLSTGDEGSSKRTLKREGRMNVAVEKETSLFPSTRQLATKRMKDSVKRSLRR